jgi:hypothetical protein
MEVAAGFIEQLVDRQRLLLGPQRLVAKAALRELRKEDLFSGPLAWVVRAWGRGAGPEAPSTWWLAQAELIRLQRG